MTLLSILPGASYGQTTGYEVYVAMKLELWGELVRIKGGIATLTNGRLSSDCQTIPESNPSRYGLKGSPSVSRSGGKVYPSC